MHFLRAYFLFSLGLIMHAEVPAQPVSLGTDRDERPIQTFVLDANEGLSQGYVKDIFEDDFGRMWLSTKNALDCYDGSEVTSYSQDASDLHKPPTPINQIHFCTGNRLLWMTDNLDQMVCFDMATRRFLYPTNDGLSKTNEHQLTATFMCLDARGNVVTNIKNGPGLIFTSTDYPSISAVETLPLEDEHPALLSLEGIKKYYWFTKQPPGPNLVSSQERLASGELFFLIDDTVRYYSDDHRALQPLFNTINPEDTIIGLLTDYSKSTCYAYSASTLFRCEQGKSLNPILSWPDTMDFRADPIFDKKNRFILHTKNSLVRTKIGSLKIELISFLLNKPSLNIDTQHTSVAHCDKNNNLWLISGGLGAIQLSSISDAIEIELLDRRGNWDSQSTIYFLAKGGNYKYDKSISQKFWGVLDAGLLDSYFPGMHWQSPPITDQGELVMFLMDDDLRLDPDLREKSKKLVALDLETEKCSQLMNPESTAQRVIGDPLFQDYDGHWWTGEHSFTSDIGINRIDIDSGTIQRFVFPTDQKATSEYRFLQCWLVNPDGTLWLGTNKGIFHLNPIDGSWKHFRSVPGNANTLPENVIFSLCYDPLQPEKFIWAGTNGGGICRLNITNGDCVTIDTKSGMPNDVIYGIHEDNYNRLWMSTNAGIAALDPETSEIRTFNVKNGLLGNEFNRYAHGKAPDDKLSFGGLWGMVLINPSEFAQSQPNAKLIFTSFSVDNTPVQIADNSNILTQSLPYTQSITVAPEVRMMGFDFTLTDLTSPRTNRYQYQLLNYSDTWIDIGAKNSVVFTNLNPGTYELKVRGQDFRGNWTTVPASMEIVVLPPWYSTWWFRSLVILSVAGMVYTFYRYRLNQLLKVERMRNRIAQDLHDDIGSTLSSISLFSQVMQETSEELSPKSLNLLRRINDNVKNMMESMNDIVWTIKAENDQLEQVVDRMRAFAVQLTEPKGIILDFSMDDTLDNLKLNMVQRKNIYLVFKEAMNNAIKYSGCTKIQANLHHFKGSIQLSISDNGKGFNVDAMTDFSVNFGGNGLQGMRKRAEEIHAKLEISSDKSGTTIRLIIPLKNH